MFELFINSDLVRSGVRGQLAADTSRDRDRPAFDRVPRSQRHLALRALRVLASGPSIALAAIAQSSRR